MNFVRVALDVPLPTLFDYRVDKLDDAEIGQRVLVPFGKKLLVGIIMEGTEHSALPSGQLRSIIRVMREIPALPPDLIDLFKFSSDYYHYPLGPVVLNALPSALRRGRPAKLVADWFYELTPAGRAIDPSALTGAKVQRVLLERLGACHRLDTRGLRALAPSAGTAIKALLAKQWVARCSGGEETRDEASPPLAPFELTSEQQLAVAAVKGTSGFAPWLLRGVTGSGKTEVYLQLIAAALAAGHQSLLLVPEINLTPQLEAMIRERFSRASLVTLHSGLNESERLHNWMKAHAGTAQIVLGTRLAVFTPLPRLGLIVVDEEQDSSFKQMDGLRYSARDIALMRAKQRRIPIVLGSATPALETFHHALTGQYRLATLLHRVNAMPPVIEYIHTRRDLLIDGLSQPLLGALRQAISRGDQSLIFINRRGYAPALMCRNCGYSCGCPRCSAKLVLHLADHGLHCHYCGHRERVPPSCPACGDQDLLPLGQGTQRVETALARFFSGARILRIDRDSTRSKHAWRQMREQIRAREVDILVGTQILAKGHDFPQLNLVGVVNADASLYSTDFRAAERLYARLTQVAGRAGRGTVQGRVLIQTEFPSHPLYRALHRGDYEAYAHELLDERKQAGFPPFVHQALLRAEASKLQAALDFLKRAIDAASEAPDSVEIYDPVPARLTKRAGLERAQLTIESPSRRALHGFLSAWQPLLAPLAARKVRFALDVDPLEV